MNDEALTRDLLEQMASIDPWERSQEGLDDGCHFCDCDDHDWERGGNPTIYRHRSGCPWMRACDLFGKTIVRDGIVHVDTHVWEGKVRETHVFYVPPPNDPPCPTCGWQYNQDRYADGDGSDSTGTVNGHEAHQAAEAGLTIQEWRAQQYRRPLENALPTIKAPRGGIQFITPLPLTVEFGRQVGVVDHIEETDSGLVVAGTVDDVLIVRNVNGVPVYEAVDKPAEPGPFAAPFMPMYDFFGVFNADPTVDYCPVCWHALPCAEHP